MEVEAHDVDMTPGNISVVKYIAVDTNVLLDEIRTVGALFRILSLSVLKSAIQLLIPQTVLYEIDNHHKLGKSSVRHQAREANRWLNRLIKSKQLDHCVPFRVQKVSEYIRDSLSRPDDRILDCCLYFNPDCEQVWLWTKDQVFETIARSNEICILQAGPLSSIVRELGIDGVAGVEELARTFDACSLVQPEVELDDSGMELDEDLYFDLPALVADIDRHRQTHVLAPGPDGTRSLLSDLLSRYSAKEEEPTTWIIEEEMMKGPSTCDPSATSSGLPSHPSPANASTRTRVSEMHVHDRLEIALAPLMAYLAIDITPPERLLGSLLTRLLELEGQLYPDIEGRAPLTQDRQVLLVAIDGTRILARYCERETFEKRKTHQPRLGEVSDAIEALGHLCDAVDLGVACSEQCRELARTIRSG